MGTVRRDKDGRYVRVYDDLEYRDAYDTDDYYEPDFHDDDDCEKDWKAAVNFFRINLQDSYYEQTGSLAGGSDSFYDEDNNRWMDKSDWVENL